MHSYTTKEVAQRLDLAVLKPECTAGDLADQAAICVARGVGCLCVRPTDVLAAVRLLRKSDVVVASVVGFPHGNHHCEVMALESRLAIADGARELDMVLNSGALFSGDVTAVRNGIASVVAESKPRGVIVKVILETCLLSAIQIELACQIAEQAGADFVKTSTGFGMTSSGPTGATPEVIRIMLDAVGGRIGVKASGGIRNWADAVRYLAMGCQRLGVGNANVILDSKP
ncbi:MAG: deoxyribose-phosphate aldolase [Planctomycetota bacterium]|nr:MAG: deoxyribose-phosphate aldolase [Planctomycetota bacterium]